VERLNRIFRSDGRSARSDFPIGIGNSLRCLKIVIFRSGLSQDILINVTPMGRTSADGKVVIPFSQPLNFRDAVMQIVTGTAKLVSHCITGFVSMNLVYSTSGKEEPAAGEARRQRTARTTSEMAKPAEGRWDAGLTLRERLTIMNVALNKNYMGSKQSARGKLSNWPATICTTPDGYVR